MANDKHYAFDLSEYRERLSKTQAEMRKCGLDGILVHQPENIYYLSGFYTTGYFSYHALLVPQSGDPVLILRDVEVPSANATSWVEQHFTYADAVDPLPVWLDTTKRAVHALKLDRAKIGVDEHSWFLTVERWKKLVELLPNADICTEPRIVDYLRIIKSPAEIAYMRKATQCVEAGVSAGISAIAEGIVERDLGAAVFNSMVNAGSEMPLSGIILSGSRTDQLHGDYTDRILQRGDNVYFEVSGIHGRYYSRIMRTATVGPARDEQHRIAEKIIAIQDAAIAMMKPGVPAAEVDAACRAPMIAAGLKKEYTNRTGYSLGLNYRPSAGEFIREFVPGVTWKLEAGMVFHMLMMGGGMGFSEMVHVTESGPELLTSMDRRLFSSSK